MGWLSPARGSEEDTGRLKPAHGTQRGGRPPALKTLYPFIASTPPMISDSSVVIWLCRARLACMLSDLIILSALSVALFIATMRDTCSLVVASRNAWNNAA